MKQLSSVVNTTMFIHLSTAAQSAKFYR